MMFDQLSKPLLGGPASKNAIQMVWGALLCKIGVDTGILIDVQSSRVDTCKECREHSVTKSPHYRASASKLGGLSTVTRAAVSEPLLAVCSHQILQNFRRRFAPPNFWDLRTVTLHGNLRFWDLRTVTLCIPLPQSEEGALTFVV